MNCIVFIVAGPAIPSAVAYPKRSQTSTADSDLREDGVPSRKSSGNAVGGKGVAPASPMLGNASNPNKADIPERKKSPAVPSVSPWTGPQALLCTHPSHSPFSACLVFPPGYCTVFPALEGWVFFNSCFFIPTALPEYLRHIYKAQKCITWVPEAGDSRIKAQACSLSCSFSDLEVGTCYLPTAEGWDLPLYKTLLTPRSPVLLQWHWGALCQRHHAAPSETQH